MRYCAFLFILALMTGVTLNATTFVPLPLDRQIKTSYGAIHAIYQGSNYKKLGNGEVVTNASFKVLETSGIKSHEIINRNDFKVIYPGGKWQGLVYRVPGAPEFQVGEEVVLLLSKGQRGFTISNLKMGKYEVYEDEGKVYLGSSAFRSHPKLGRISFMDFERILTANYGSGFRSYHHDKYIANGDSDKKVGRSIASEEQSMEEEQRSTMSIYWLVLIFGLMGSYSAYIMKRKR